MAEQPVWSPQRLNGLAHAFRESCALHAGVRLGVTARLCQAPGTAAQLARELELDQRGLGMLLTALTTLGLLVKDDDLYQVHPEAAPFLTPGSPQDLSHIIGHNANLVPAWSKLDVAVKTGRPVRGERSQEDLTNFYRGMRDLSRLQAKGLAARLGLRAGQRLLDLGGGPGVYGYTFADETPGLKVTVLDLPDSERYFQEEAAGRPQAANVRRLNGSYKEIGLGGPYDVIWISQVLHGESPPASEALIRKAAGELAPGGTLWIQEFVVDPEGKGHPNSALFSLNMLVNTQGGQAYSEAELRGFLVGAGLVDARLVGPTAPHSPASLVKAVKPA